MSLRCGLGVVGLDCEGEDRDGEEVAEEEEEEEEGEELSLAVAVALDARRDELVGVLSGRRGTVFWSC